MSMAGFSFLSLLENPMRNVLVGELVFFTFVTVSQAVTGGAKDRTQRRVLAKVMCEYSECEEKLAHFKEDNNHIMPREIHAQFTYQEFIG
jgi:hypothetical protein